MRRKGTQAQKRGGTKAQVSVSLDPEAFERIEALARDGNKSRSLVMAELIEVGISIIEKRRKAAKTERGEER